MAERTARSLAVQRDAALAEVEGSRSMLEQCEKAITEQERAYRELEATLSTAQRQLRAQHEALLSAEEGGKAIEGQLEVARSESRQVAEALRSRNTEVSAAPPSHVQAPTATNTRLLSELTR